MTMEEGGKEGLSAEASEIVLAEILDDIEGVIEGRLNCGILHTSTTRGKRRLEEPRKTNLY